MSYPVHIVVPLEPCSVNVYVRHCVIKGKIARFKSKDAKAFEKAGALCIGGQKLEAKAYIVRIEIYQGKGHRGDLDNYAKQPLDLLKEHGVIRSDAAITALLLRKFRDPARPRTEIFVASMDEAKGTR